ncbi:Uncharacterized protein PECH_000381 [Penicillium ucsense]|uniref:DUF1996 domain-containing protein n=1 Tax=Penicillium ucsense TaxID=2839758 RepID=A0A8J8W5U3_9EURO|nr:Uncharacterized protein PECM_004279 [Penicillium ucsense]KAF7733606.1 Uncharacterized protein PECH_000381 [Penicillium ucsense]
MLDSHRLTAALVASLTLFPGLSDAFWRLPCRGRAGVARLDPIVDPNTISNHVHVIHGSGSFGMDSNTESLLDSDCTSCAVKQDKSAYWTPALYFMHSNGSAEMVEQVGGMLAYYLQYGDNIKAFPDDFRMLAGDPYQRNFTWPVPDPPKSSWTGDAISQAALRQKALGFNCLHYASAPEGSLYRHFLPDKKFLDEHCTDGIRLELLFPSCWNGKDTDSPDHRSHVAYPTLGNGGTCPKGFETRLATLFFETIWNTYAFKDHDGYFTLANGDPTGYGYHGDFMNGWETGVLQKALDTCTDPSGEVEACGIFELQDDSAQGKCQIDIPAAIAHEDVMMHERGIPGPMEISWGPEYAAMDMNPSGSSASSGHSSKSSSSSSSTTTTTSSAERSVPTIAVPAVSVGQTIDVSKMLGHADAIKTVEPATSASTTAAAVVTSGSAPASSVVVDAYPEMIIYVQQEMVVMLGDNGVPIATTTGALRTVSSTLTTALETSTVVANVVKREAAPPTLQEPDIQVEVLVGSAQNRHHGHIHKRHGH